jgi:hypothetical protein
MEDLLNAAQIDHSEYNEDVVLVLCNTLEHDWSAISLSDIRKCLKFHSLNDIEQVRNEKALVQFLNIADQRNLIKHPEVTQYLQHLRTSKVFWREHFNINCIQRSKKFNLFTLQALTSIYLQADGNLDPFEDGKRFETQQPKAALPWTLSNPLQHVTSSLAPNYYASPMHGLAPIALNMPIHGTAAVSTPTHGTAAGLHSQPGGLSLGSGFRTPGKPPLSKSRRGNRRSALHLPLAESPVAASAAPQQHTGTAVPSQPEVADAFMKGA